MNMAMLMLRYEVRDDTKCVQCFLSSDEWEKLFLLNQREVQNLYYSMD